MTSLPRQGEHVQIRMGDRWFPGVVQSVSSRGARVRLLPAGQSRGSTIIFLTPGGPRVFRYPEERESGPWPPVRG